jgi:hypothetical protein
MISRSSCLNGIISANDTGTDSRKFQTCNEYSSRLTNIQNFSNFLNLVLIIIN